jgi:hypothetical protein
LLREGDELVLWAHPTLSNALSLLWLIDWLCERDEAGALTLVLDPVQPYRDAWSTEQIAHFFEQRVDVRPLAERLAEVRRTLSSPSAPFGADLSQLPEPVASWLAVTELLLDYLPDVRGLDLFDSLLLDQLGDEWSKASYAVAHMLTGVPPAHNPATRMLWERMVELSDLAEAAPGGCSEPGFALCEMRLSGPASMLNAEVRITKLGKSVRSGRRDAIQGRGIHRWVGGKLIAGGI